MLTLARSLSNSGLFDNSLPRGCPDSDSDGRSRVPHQALTMHSWLRQVVVAVACLARSTLRSRHRSWCMTVLGLLDSCLRSLKEEPFDYLMLVPVLAYLGRARSLDVTFSAHVPPANRFKGIRAWWRWLCECHRRFGPDIPGDSGIKGFRLVAAVEGASSQRDGIGAP